MKPALYHNTLLANVLRACNHKFIAQNIPAGAVKDIKEVFASDFAQSMVLEEEIDGVITKRVKSVGFRIS